MIDARSLARPLLASSFVVAGYQALRNPGPLGPAAAEVGGPIVEKVGLRADPLTLVQVNAAAQMGAGLLLALGRLPRVSSLVLAASLVPTTLAAHRFWESAGDDERRAQAQQFLKNAAMLGGLVLAALDTGGRPSVFWSSRRWLGRTGRSIGATAQAVAEHVPTTSAAA
jgi:uncharacterized membrane protein YphA (DoxX/SURF4 family)